MEDEDLSLLISYLESADVHLCDLFVLQLLILLRLENTGPLFLDIYLILLFLSGLLDALTLLSIELLLNLTSDVDNFAILHYLFWQIVQELLF